MIDFTPPYLFATIPIGPPLKNKGVNPGKTITVLCVASRINIARTVPMVVKIKPKVAAFGEKGSMAATSIAGTAFGTSFS